MYVSTGNVKKQFVHAFSRDFPERTSAEILVRFRFSLVCKGHYVVFLGSVLMKLSMAKD